MARTTTKTYTPLLALAAAAPLVIAVHACSDDADDHKPPRSLPHALSDAGADAAQDAAVAPGPEQVMPCYCIASLHITKNAACSKCVGATQVDGKACEKLSDACLADPKCIAARNCLDHCKPEDAECFGACFLPVPGDSEQVLEGKKKYEKLAYCYCPPCEDECAYDEPFACLGIGDAGAGDGG